MRTLAEVDEQVRELSRGGNAAVRGVVFANMYIKVDAYEKALAWLVQFLAQRERDAEALQLSGACHLKLNRPKEALEFYRKSLEARPKVLFST